LERLAVKSSGAPMAQQRMLTFVAVDQQTPEKREAEERRADFHEIYADFIEAKANEQSSRCSQCGVPFCQTHCPLGNNIPDWLMLTANGRLEEAYEISAATSNMPEICRAHLPAGSPLRRRLRHRAIRPPARHHRRGRTLHHRHRLGARLGPAGKAPARTRRASASSARVLRVFLPPTNCVRRATASPSTTATIAQAAY